MYERIRNTCLIAGVGVIIYLLVRNVSAVEEMAEHMRAALD